MKIFLCLTLIVAMVHLGSSQMPCKEQIQACVASAKEAYTRMVKKMCEVHKKILVEQLKPTLDKHMNADACKKIVQSAMGSYMKDKHIGSEECLGANDQKKMKNFADPAMGKICTKCIAPMVKKHAKVDVCKDNDNTIIDDMKQCIIGEMMPAMMSAQGAADAVKKMCKTDICKAKLAASCGNIVVAFADDFNPEYNDGWKPQGFPKDKMSSADGFINDVRPVVKDMLANMRKMPK